MIATSPPAPAPIATVTGFPTSAKRVPAAWVTGPARSCLKRAVPTRAGRFPGMEPPADRPAFAAPLGRVPGPAKSAPRGAAPGSSNHLWAGSPCASRGTRAAASRTGVVSARVIPIGANSTAGGSAPTAPVRITAPLSWARSRADSSPSTNSRLSGVGWASPTTSVLANWWAVPTLRY